jgi:hypothetical protein
MGGAAKRKSGKRHAVAGSLNSISAASDGQYSCRSKGMSDPTESYVEIAPGKEGAVRKHVCYRVIFH